MTSAKFRLSRVTISLGVPFGANRPSQVRALKGGRPASWNVGTFGRVGSLSSPSTRSALISPLLTFSSNGPVPGVNVMTWICPASSANVAGATP